MPEPIHDELPVWDDRDEFGGVDTLAFTAAFDDATRAIDDLVTLFDRLAIDAGANVEADRVAATFDELIAAWNDISARLERLEGYLYSLRSADTRAEGPQIAVSRLETKLVELLKLEPRLTAWIGAIDVPALLAASPPAREHAYLVEQLARLARHLMSPAEESLAAELRRSGGHAWSRLYDDVASQIEAPFEHNGETRPFPMSELRLLAHDARRDVRERAYRAEIAAWETHAVPIAAALNGVKGESLTLAQRRGWAAPLDAALFNNAIDAGVLEAMLAAAEEAYPDCHTYYAAKARLLGVERLAWWDLFAPVGAGGARSWSWPRCSEAVVRAFEAFGPRLAGLARSALAERWIDAKPRPGKEDGAYCIGMGEGRSRVLMNFEPSYSSAATLAHELGHAYHNLNLASRTPAQRREPSTLAETASTFCETLLRRSALADAGPAEELTILEGFLLDAAQVIVDIPSRFLFERSVFALRAERDLQVSELCDLMTDAQRATYGDALAPDDLHPYMWAAKGHYYRAGEDYYNFPYLFGLLFSLGLFRRYQDAPAAFLPAYDELLADSGRASAVDLAARMDIDLRAPDFWRSAFDVVRADIRRYVTLAADAAA